MGRYSSSPRRYHHRHRSPSRHRHHKYRSDSRRRSYRRHRHSKNRYNRDRSSTYNYHKRYSRHRRRSYSRDRYHRSRSRYSRHHHHRHHSYKRRSSDEIVHFKWEKGQKVGDYTIINKICDGTFGRVLYCEKDGQNYALKVIRDVERYTNSAKIEIDILLDIKDTDVDNQSRCVILHDHFLHKNKHMCLAFEPLGLSLYEFLDKNDFKGFFIADIQHIAHQSLKALAFLKQKISFIPISNPKIYS